MSADLPAGGCGKGDGGPRLARAAGIFGGEEGARGGDEGGGFEADGYFIGALMKGGMSEVRRGRHLATGREVVLKSVPLADEEEGAGLTARLQQEAEALGLLARDGQRTDIAELVEFRVIGGRPRLVMGLVEGMSLKDWQGQPGITDRQRVEVVRQVAVAVGYAHGRGVAHRDVKPSNVMIRPDGNAVVLDFGIAALLDASGIQQANRTLTGAVVGTVRYMSPEQAGDRCLLPKQADVYALGVVLFELLTGELPVKDRGEPDLKYMGRLVKEAPRRLTRVRRDVERGADLEVVCVRAMMHDPDLRPGAGMLAEELGRWLRGEAVLSRPLTWRESTAQAVRRHPWQWGLAAVFLLAVLGTAAGMFRLAGQREEARREAEEARAGAQRTEAASLAAVAAGTAARGQVDEATPGLIVALRLDPQNEVAGWVAGQTLLDRWWMTPVGGAAFSTGSPDAYYYGMGRRVFYGVRGGDGVLCRGVVAEDGGLEVKPWPGVLPGCAQVALSADEGTVVVLFTDGALRAFAAGNGAMLWECGPRVASEHTMRLSQSGRLVVQASAAIAGAGLVSVLRVVALADGRVVQDRPLKEQTSGVRLAVTHDDRWLVMGAVHTPWLGCMYLADGTLRDLTVIWTKPN